MYPPAEPFDSGYLLRPDGARVYWETSGNPYGRPALYLHGGPGSGLGPGGYRRRFNPDRYLIVGLDQRGCGRSTPLAKDRLDTLATNTTQTQIADLEALRESLGIGSWLVHGVSWGSTLALAYALAHPARVSAMVLTAVTTGSRAEVDWITEGMARIFPEAWAEYAMAARPGERVVDAYARLLRDPDPRIREDAATSWNAWETTHISLDPNWTPTPVGASARYELNFATLVTHYWSNDCFLRGEDAILERAGELAGIPGVLIHGRFDVSGPAITPWRLHQRWPGSHLEIVETEGHGGTIEMALTRAAIDTFAETIAPPTGPDAS